MSRLKLSQIKEISLTSPSNGQALAYNTSTSKWENQTISGGGGSAEGRITNTVINTGFPYTISTPATTVTTLKYLIDNGSSAVSINLPSAAGDNANLRIEIKRRGTALVSVVAATSPSQQYIDGVTQIDISSQYATLVIDSDGTGWNIK
jgi:hypothetical protein